MNMDSYVCCTNNSSEIGRVEELGSLLKVLAETSRLKLLCMLRQNEHCVCELIEHLGLSQSLISHHLQDLKESKLVSDEKRGSYVYYSLTSEGKRITDLIFKV